MTARNGHTAHQLGASRRAPDDGGLRVHVGDLLGRPAHHRDVAVAGAVPGLVTTSAGEATETPVDFELRLEAIPEGIVAIGHVSGTWTAECSRCLDEVTGVFDTEVHELFERGAQEGDTYPLEGDEIDLEPLARDAVMPLIPLAPLCDEACAGLCPVCGTNLNEGACDCPRTDPDPRWSVLGALTFDDPPPSE